MSRITSGQRLALLRAAEFGRVSQAHGDGFDHHRPDVAAKATLESLRARGLLEEVQGPRYMPTYTITDAGREAIAPESEG